MPLALSQFDPLPMNREFTPSSNYAVNEAKNSALMGEYQRKKEASQRLSGRMPDVQKAIQNHDIMNQGVQDLMEVNPELYKTMADAVKAQDEAAKIHAEKTANFMAGAVPYIAGAEDRGQTKEQAWGDYLNFARQSGVPLGQFDNAPYSDNALALLKSSIYGIKGVLEGGATIKQENGALVTRTPLGDVKDVKVLPQERTDKPLPLRTYKSGNKEITEEYVDGKWRVKSTSDAYKPEADANKPPTGYRWNATGALEPIPGGPADKPATTPAMQASEDERKAAGWVVQAGNALDNLKEAIASNPEAMKQPLFEAVLPDRFVNAFRSEDRQRFVQAASSFAEAALRAATGAGMNESEARGKIAELTPVFGDKPPVIKQKLNSLTLYLKSLEARAGRALPNAEQALAARGGKQQVTQQPAQQAMQIPKKAADHLRANPSLRQYFDQKYGAGASARILGR